jgi:eukaryotic-like serine/threonine-protein kinase
VPEFSLTRLLDPFDAMRQAMADSGSAPRERFPSTAPAKQGEGLIAGRYKILEAIDGGGQAEIFRGQDLTGGPDVAIKVLRESFASDPQFQERMAREAQVLASLQSPATLRTFGFYWTTDKRPCVVMELLTGLSLGDFLTQLEGSGRRLTNTAVLACMGPVASSLDEAHAQGVIHRDLKPDNIFVLKGEEWEVPAKLLDFGFAKFLKLSSITAQGTVAGSPRYIAPEGWRGEQNLTPAFDMYSYGAVVFRCLTGQPPYPDGDLITLLRLVTQAPIPKITQLRPDLPPCMDAWVEQALAKDAQSRFRSMAEQFERLEQCLNS